MPAAVDTFNGASYGVGDTYPHAFAITPSDSADLAFVTRAIKATAAGNIAVIMLGGETITFPVAANEVLRIRAKRVNATSTTATGLIGLY